MKESIKDNLIMLLVDIFLLGAYWLCEAVVFTWLYAIEPVAILVGIVSVVALIAGVISKKTWVTIVFPSTTLVSVAGLATITMLLKNQPLI